MQEYPVYISGERVGTLVIGTEGIRTRFSVCCKYKSGLIRLSLFGGGRSFYLGLLEPDGDELRLERRFSRAQLRELPQYIEYAADIELRRDGEGDTLWYPAACGALVSFDGDSSMIALPTGRLRSFPTRFINGRLYAVFPGKRRLQKIKRL